MSVLADTRPDEWNLPLFLHVLGAMVVIGSLVLAATYLVPAWRTGSAAALRSGYRTLVFLGIPAYLLMRVAAQWIADEEGYTGDDDPAWIGIGFMVSDVGLLLLAAAAITAGVGLRRANRDGVAEAPGARVGAVLVSVLLVAYVIAIWAMTTKPA